MYLADTNIFLEILLNQDKRKKCKKFLDKNINLIHISDFSLHSLALLLFRYNKEDVFQKFIKDFLPKTKLLSLPKEEYKNLTESKKNLNLDFDDLYQYNIARFYNLNIVTLDNDFQKIKDIEIKFL